MGVTTHLCTDSTTNRRESRRMCRGEALRSARLAGSPNMAPQASNFINANVIIVRKEMKISILRCFRRCFASSMMTRKLRLQVNALDNLVREQRRRQEAIKSRCLHLVIDQDDESGR